MIAPGPLKKHHQKMVYRMKEKSFTLAERIAIAFLMICGTIAFLVLISNVLP